MLSSAQRLIAALIQEGSMEMLFKHGPIAHLFKGNEAKLWTHFDGHVKKYGTFPDFDLVKADTGFDLGPQPQPSAFYLDRARQNHLQQSLIATFGQVHEKFLKPGPSAGLPSDGLQSIAQTVMGLMTEQMGSQVIDYRHAYDLIMQAYKAKSMDDGKMGLRMGWPTLDAATGGLSVGDLISFVGRPKMGKTWFLLHAALFAWMEQGKTVLFQSNEIKPLPILQRLLALQAHLPAKGIREAQLSSSQLKTMQAALAKTKKGEAPFYVVDGNLTSSVSDLYALTRQLKPDLVVIDGAYLLTHPTERDLYKRVAINCNLIKQQICDLAPTLCSWQFARRQKGQKSQKKEAQSLDEIGYSDGIGQLSSLVCGISEDESAETLKQRKIDIIAGRNGESGSFNVKWDFEWTTDFSEIVPDSPEQVEELHTE
jgi:replicative DNA helicase